jgi:hypothetical protein
VSVSRLRLADDLTGTRLWGRLLREGVHSVPCRPFYWANGRTGERYLRIALAREPEVVIRAGEAVRSLVEAWPETIGDAKSGSPPDDAAA